MPVTITTTAENTYVQSPYNSLFVDAARQLGGRWSDPQWVFPLLAEPEVRALCLRVYGTDGTSEPTMATYTVKLSGYSARGKTLSLAGITIAKVWDRDGGAKIFETAVITGSINSGGSRKSPDVVWAQGTTIKFRAPLCLRDVIEKDTLTLSVDAQADVTDRDMLMKERERLISRIAEIDAELA